MMKSMNIMILMFMNFNMINLMLLSIMSNYKHIHPMIMGSVLLTFNIFTTMNLNLFFNNSWFSLITFLIIIGGMMILFLYFTSFIMNMITSMNLNFVMIMNFKFILLALFTMFIMFNFKKFFIWYNNFNEINNIFMNLNNKNFDKNFFTMFMYTNNKNLISLICISYLLITLTLIVKMIFIHKYSMRKIN